MLTNLFYVKKLILIINFKIKKVTIIEFLENYGRPYNEDGKTTGTYYKHAKRKASDMHNW